MTQTTPTVVDPYLWLNTQPNPHVHGRGYDHGQRGWRFHAVKGKPEETFDDVRWRRALCGLLPRHGWHIDMYMNEEDRCERCEKAAGLAPTPRNAFRAAAPSTDARGVRPMSRGVSIRDIDPAMLGPNSPLHALLRRKPRRDLEHQEQVALFEWAADNEAKYPDLKWMFAVPNGGFRHKATAGRLKAEGAKAGVLDVWLPLKRRNSPGLVIEMKIAPNSPTKEQGAWIRHLHEEGWLVVVAYSADEAKRIVIDYLAAA